MCVCAQKMSGAPMYDLVGVLWMCLVYRLDGTVYMSGVQVG